MNWVIRKRIYLTFIEMMIVIAIVVLIAGVVGFNIRGALLAQQFRSEVDVLVDNLRMAQDLMLILGKDTHLIIKTNPDGQGIIYHLEVEGGTAKEWDPILKETWKQMRSTHFVDFVKEDEFSSKPGEIDIRFQSSGMMMSKGVLALSTHEDPYVPQAMRRAICLRGYPYPIQSEAVLEVPVQGKPWIVCEDQKQTESFFERLTFYTVEEIKEDVPPKGIDQNQPSDEKEKPNGNPPPSP